MKLANGFYTPAQLNLPVTSPIRGVVVGGCPYEDAFREAFGVRIDLHEMRHSNAHTHCAAGDQFRGVVCVEKGGNVLRQDGSLTTLMLHEETHLLVPFGDGHGPSYTKALRQRGLADEADRVERLYSGRPFTPLQRTRNNAVAAGILGEIE